MTRTKGTLNRKYLKWNITIFDKETNSFRGGKYSTIQEANEDLNLNLNNDLIWRIQTKNRVDTEQKHKDKSFIARYGHIKVEKIKELRTET